MSHVSDICSDPASSSVASSAAAPRGSLFWTFVNSKFGLWLLSALLLSALPYFWSSWISASQREAEVNAEVARVDLELAYRLRLFKQALLNIKSGRVKLTSESLDEAFAFIEPIAPVPSRSYVFSEFKERSVPALIWEARNLLEEASRQEVDRACVAALEMALFRSNFMADPTDRDVKLELQSLETYLEKLWIDRWVYLDFVEDIYE